MIQSYNKIKYFLMPCMAFLLFLFLVFANNNKVYAAVGFEYYSYDKIYEKLPSKFKSDTYIYKSNDIPLISFATYNGNDYRTSVKKSDNKNDFIYCCDYSKHIVFGKVFSPNNNMFNNILRARIGTALYNGTTQWGTKASDEFTTGNFITDYYMTQIVIHCLIYEYGGKYSDYGVDYSKLKFKSNAGTIKKKSKELLDYCCGAKIEQNSGSFQNPEFSITKPQTDYLYADQDYLYSQSVQCNSLLNGATIKSSTEKIVSDKIASEDIEVIREGDSPVSNFRIRIPIQKIENLTPGMYVIGLTKEVTYNRVIAGFWKSTNNASQETTGLIPDETKLEDYVEFRFIVGDVTLEKHDAFTNAIITDAVFELKQYNLQNKSYEPYRQMKYNANTKKYEGGRILINKSNPDGLFQISEKTPGNNYKNDWNGVTFAVTDEVQHFEFYAENEPYLGSLTINKKGENLEFAKNEFVNKNQIPLGGITFALYADNNINKLDKVLFKKGQHITNFVTDSNGTAIVNNLPLGDYYFKEVSTLELYELDPKEYHFSITKENNGKYSEKKYDLLNVLKKCKINLFKYDGEGEKKLPLEGARFGLYCSEKITDINKKVILEKDSLIAEKVTDKNGQIVFSGLPYADYYIKELKAPSGYIINDGVVTIKKGEFTAEKPVTNEKEPNEKEANEKESNFAQYKKDLDNINQKQYYCIQLYKSGESFTDIINQSSENGDYFQYSITTKPLEKVTFALYSEDNTLIEKKETNADGIAFFTGLLPGKYYYVEDSCPGLYAIDSAKKEIEIKPDTIKNPEYYTNEKEKAEGKRKQPILKATANNNYCSVSLAIQKQGEVVKAGKNSLSYETVPLGNIVFGLYQNFDYKLPSDHVASKGMCVGYLVTKEDGTADFNGKLPEGQYFMKEIKTAAGYDLDTRIYYFDVKANHNKNIVIQLDNQNVFTNQLSKSSVQIIKTDADTGKKLKGVEFTLYNSEHEAIGIYKTDRQGKIEVSDLPYGNYYFVETKAKYGYYATNNKYKFTLDNPEQVILNITNAPILKLGFEEHYKFALIAVILLIVGFGGLIGFFELRIRRR